MFHSLNRQFLIAFSLTIAILSCQKPKPLYNHIVIREDSIQGPVRAREIMDNTAISLADGIKMELWATDSLAPDPIAMSIDDYGRVYLTRTNRQKHSEFDIRGHRDWMTASIALQSAEERREFLHKTFSPENSAQNEWLTDLNKDGIHDWKDLAVEEEEVWQIEDLNQDGLADVSTRILSDFHDEVTDVAGALLIRRNDMFVGVGPDMWRLEDTDGDGRVDIKKSISHGYAVHIGFGGHGMSGVIEGPDGKIYWGIGDIGANLTALDGSIHKYPNQGVLVRSNPDGSNFEVFAAGLRNTHEFVFDEYGNIIGADNDGDHPGESERLVHIVEGSDAGWRSNWQYGKYTDSRNNEYKVWMEERLFVPRWEGQAAYIMPPITNYHNGPTGMVYNPGTTLGSAWKNKFFLVEFVGNPSRSHIWSFSLKPKGASFNLNEDIDLMSGVLTTGIRFGPDGALYAADWVNGWDTKNYGRVWRIDVTDDKNDLAEIRKETKELMVLDYKDQSTDRLYELLFHEDMRIRLKAQYELANRNDDRTLSKAIGQTDNLLARIHGIWGLGQILAYDPAQIEQLVSLLGDNDPEIITQAAKVIGDLKYAIAGNSLLPLLEHQNPRTQFYAAQALGRIKMIEAVDPLIKMIESNNDEDLYIRHAGVLALSRIGLVDPIVALSDHSSFALRVAAVLVLRRMANEKVAVFLKDQDEYIVTEAARAINDDFSIEKALPALAATLSEERFRSEALLRRAINAALRVGGGEQLDLLIAFAQRPGLDPVLKGEAIATLATWPNPSVLDRVDGRYRGEIKRDVNEIRPKITPMIAQLLKSLDAEVVSATITAIAELGISDYNDQLVIMAKSHKNPDVRSSALKYLVNAGAGNSTQIIRAGLADQSEIVRSTAVSYLADLETNAETLSQITAPILSRGTISEQQELVKVLGTMPLKKSESTLSTLADQLISGKLSGGITLELIEAIEASGSENLASRIESIRSSDPNSVDFYKEALYGGDRRQGGRYVYTNSTGQCTRCHALNEGGANVGPPLMNIGNTHSREQILEALVNPSARISPGYGNVTLTLADGQTVTGILEEETNERLIIRTNDAEPLEVPVSRISSRTNLPSSMPPMGQIMSRRELRDVIEFLVNLKQ
ncbi:MAG: HEAT repeat domain-containing protein [Bacteroidetes bacterium]|nr:HEAT repeat domain-containing protein [Bacteroidota bacterium]MDA1121899.1 HEAT repeat domain-containing protein [Bacteroidota bacterium]